MALTILPTRGKSLTDRYAFHERQQVRVNGFSLCFKTTLSIPLTIVYNTPSGKANLSVSVSVQITDDRSNQVTATGQTSVL